MATIHQELAPIVIGITGERELAGKHSPVSRALKAIFDCLDDRYPTSPKILLTRLAQGVDALGAKDVLERRAWEIVAPLPLPLDLYLEGFEDRAAQQLRRLIEEANSRKRLRMFTLDALRRKIEHPPVMSSEYAQTSEMPISERADHYEQAGLFIAERCAILIAVTRAGERPDRIDDTGRLVRYRLHGDLDDGARAIVRRSRVLIEPAPLDVPVTGPVWLVDLSAVDRDQRGTTQAGFTPLLPGKNDSSPTHRPLRECFRLADRLDEFNTRAQQLDQAPGNPSSAEGDMPLPAARLSELMHALSSIQLDMNRKLKWTFWSLGCLFCIAFFMFEAQIDLNKQWGVFGYIGAVFLGIAIYKFAWARRWQPFAQDYRAVAEALRVQIAWWNCGLVGPRHRVDRFYLRGARGSLGLVRAAIRHMIDATTLRSCHDGHFADRLVRKARTEANEEQCADDGLKWIEEQIAYFDNRLSKRRTWVSFVDALSWFLIVASLGPEVVFAIHTFRSDIVAPVVEQSLGLLRPGVLFLTVVAAIILTFLVSAAPWVFSPSARADRTKRIFERPNLAVAAVAGLLLAIGLYDGAVLITTERVGPGLLVFSGVLVASIAYAMQFVGDRLAWAREMRGYEDTLEIFRRASSALTAVAGADVDAAERKIQRDAIIETLGIEALNENESWLRAHRERPLEPLPPT